MSSQKGNLKKSGPQKHKNKTSFRNNLHDTSVQTKRINNVVATGVCHRCKDAIDWKIKYKKYKPLSQPRSCNTCHQKTVKQAYYTICTPCAQDLKVCQKCGEKKDVAIQPGLSAAEQAFQDTQLKYELKRLSERQRRAFFRLQESGKLQSESVSADSQSAGNATGHNDDSDSHDSDGTDDFSEHSHEEDTIADKFKDCSLVAAKSESCECPIQNEIDTDVSDGTNKSTHTNK